MHPPTNIPAHLLDSLIRMHGLKYFVETGTNRGHTAALMAQTFEKVWTVELAPEVHALAVESLRALPNVVSELGTSPEFIRGVYSKLDKPTLFWLDAHWCGDARHGPECPLLDELKAIGDMGGLNGRHVVLIDDARLFMKPPPPPHKPEDWPMIPQIREVVATWRGVQPCIINDVILIEPVKV